MEFTKYDSSYMVYDISAFFATVSCLTCNDRGGKPKGQELILIMCA